jgi:hypothetical protein
MVASTTISSGIVFNWGKSGLLVGGGNWDGGNSYFSGYISNLRVVKGTAQYSIFPLNVPSAELALVGDSYSANTTLLLNGNLQTTTVLGDNIFDSSSNALAITRIGTPTINASSPFTNAGISGNSIYFNGSTDYLNTTSSALNLTDTDFTIEAWVYLDFSGIGSYDADTFIHITIYHITDNV